MVCHTTSPDTTSPGTTSTDIARLQAPATSRLRQKSSRSERKHPRYPRFRSLPVRFGFASCVWRRSSRSTVSCFFSLLEAPPLMQQVYTLFTGGVRKPTGMSLIAQKLEVLSRTWRQNLKVFDHIDVLVAKGTKNRGLMGYVVNW